MITCRDLLELDPFRMINLVAGHKGLDRPVSWVYTKQTENIKPWVKGNEFLMISGYRYNFDKQNLLDTIQEAEDSNISGILVEGAINFKHLPSEALDLANELNMPLFFTSSACSFIDISQSIIRLIMKGFYIEETNANILIQLLDADTLTKEKLDTIHKSSGIDNNAVFDYAFFRILGDSAEDEGEISRGLNNMEVAVHKVLTQHNLRDFHVLRRNSIQYLLYGNDEEELKQVTESVRKTGQLMQNYCSKRCILSFSSIFDDLSYVPQGFSNALFTNILMEKNLIIDNVDSFEDTGSYSFIESVNDKNVLMEFRDRYLFEIYQDRDLDLVGTLNAYFRNNGNMLKTSESLYIHRNTLKYRLNKVKKITGLDIDDFNVRRDFQNALMILDVFPYE